MASTTENVKLGTCSVLFGGVNLGYTKGGVEVAVETATHEVTVDQFGSTPISELITGRTVTATVPLAETTLENLVAIMPGATLTTNGAKASGTITIGTNPTADKTVTVAGTTFTFATSPSIANDVAIGLDAAGTATNLAAAINAASIGYVATAAAAVVTVKSKATGSGWNATISTSDSTSLTVVSLTGGADATSANVVVKTGVNTNLLDVAQELILRPLNTFGEDDFKIYKAACPGALRFSYSVENERVFSAEFKGYSTSAGALFAVGN